MRLTEYNALTLLLITAAVVQLNYGEYVGREGGLVTASWYYVISIISDISTIIIISIIIIIIGICSTISTISIISIISTTNIVSTLILCY